VQKIIIELDHWRLWDLGEPRADRLGRPRRFRLEKRDTEKNKWRVVRTIRPEEFFLDFLEEIGTEFAEFTGVTDE
jgi:hypothetical protein